MTHAWGTEGCGRMRVRIEVADRVKNKALKRADAEREVRRRLRQRLDGNNGHPAGIGSVSAETILGWLDDLERELLGEEK